MQKSKYNTTCQSSFGCHLFWQDPQSLTCTDHRLVALESCHLPFLCSPNYINSRSLSAYSDNIKIVQCNYAGRKQVTCWLLRYPSYAHVFEFYQARDSCWNNWTINQLKLPLMRRDRLPCRAWTKSCKECKIRSNSRCPFYCSPGFILAIRSLVHLMACTDQSWRRRCPRWPGTRTFSLLYTFRDNGPWLVGDDSLGDRQSHVRKASLACTQYLHEISHIQPVECRCRLIAASGTETPRYYRDSGHVELFTAVQIIGQFSAKHIAIPGP